MISQIGISPTDDNVYNFDAFEFVENGGKYYILCDEGYFSIDGIENFIPCDTFYIIRNEDEDRFEISIEDFEKIKDILLSTQDQSFLPF